MFLVPYVNYKDIGEFISLHDACIILQNVEEVVVPMCTSLRIPLTELILENHGQLYTDRGFSHHNFCRLHRAMYYNSRAKDL